MLTGEYVVLNGAEALAVPLRLGQQMDVFSSLHSENTLKWTSEDTDGEFFTGEFSLRDFSILSSTDDMAAEFVASVLKGVRQINKGFLNDDLSYQVHCTIEFSRQYGFGSSSTFICNVAQWAEVDPLELNQIISEGSGYDIAVGMAGTPIIYQLVNGTPEIFKVELNYIFTDKLLLVYLGHKQSTSSSISMYKPDAQVLEDKVKEISQITNHLLEVKSVKGFQNALHKHEAIVGELIGRTPLKESVFADFKGEIKSLGAWGGDFILAVSDEEITSVEQYFKSKGYTTLLPFNDLVITR